MAKKKLVLKKVKPPKKAPKPAAKSKPAAKPAASKQVAAKTTAKPAKKPLAKSSTAKSSALKSSSAANTPAARSSPSPAAAQDSGSLGRPLVTQEEKLYMLFHEDYEARQVFEFLQVETVADLEKRSPEEIIRVLTAPVRRTVQRIRQRLAEKNRSLQGDEEFTRQHKARLSH